MKYVYPHQVPAVETIKASRGAAPRDNFRVTTAEVDDEARATGAGSTPVEGRITSTQGELGESAISSSSVGAGEIRQNDSSVESAIFKHLA